MLVPCASSASSLKASSSFTYPFSQYLRHTYCLPGAVLDPEVQQGTRHKIPALMELKCHWGKQKRNGINNKHALPLTDCGKCWKGTEAVPWWAGRWWDVRQGARHSLITKVAAW